MSSFVFLIIFYFITSFSLNIVKKHPKVLSKVKFFIGIQYNCLILSI
jgi:hypothetical protein